MKHVLPFVIAPLLTACGSKDDPAKGSADTADVAADPACAKQAAELEPFLATLYSETASVEINMGWQPQVIDRPAAPIEDDLDNATITPTGQHVFDASERNHADVVPGNVAERLAQTFAKKVAKQSHTKLRLDVDTDARWSDVVAVVEAATAAGYTHVVVAFETQSKLVPPPGVEARTTSRGAQDQAEAALAALKKKCRPLRDVGLDTLRDTSVEHARARAKKTAAAIATCNCAAPPDEVRAAIWTTQRWHQAHTRTSVELKLSASGAAIEQPAATPWSTAHAKLLAARGAVKLVATK